MPPVKSDRSVIPASRGGPSGRAGLICPPAPRPAASLPDAPDVDGDTAGAVCQIA
jgi:hypothetical protein